MADALDPAYASRLADDAYLLKDGVTQLLFLARHAKDMEVAQMKMASAVTGGYILKKPHVMAVFSAGKGLYQGQAFAAFMGTASLYDALSDLNTGVTISHTGVPVHQGFHRAFDSVLPELQGFVAGLKGVTDFHCVGHSLGGAVATLAADWLRHSGGVARANLYTFGCPRVGLELFAGTCTQRIKSDNIYRAYHETDPVPMVPTWPFFHVPLTDPAYLLPSPVAPVPWEYHLMKHYLHSVKDAKDWPSVLAIQPPSYGEAAIQKWLQADSVVTLTASTLGLLGAALQYVLELAAKATGIVLTTNFASAFTLLDRMAMVLASAAQLVVTTSAWIHHLVRRLGALVGVVVKEGTPLTVEFIRIVFVKLQHQISEMVRQISRNMG